MEKRKVTITINGKECSFYSDDSEEYIAALAKKANAAMKRTAEFSGGSAYTNAVLAVLYLTDRLMRTEQKGSRKSVPKAAEKEDGHVSVWDLMEEHGL